MKNIKPEPVRHGEVILKPSTLPKEAKLKIESKKYIVAHSETGHHHVLEAVKDIKVYSWKGDTYVEVPELAELWHQKTGADVHKTHKIAPSVYKVIIKKSYNYFSKIMERVRD